MVRLASAELVPKVALTEAVIVALTGAVFAEKVAVVFPLATITDAGTVVFAFAVDKFTTVPVAPAFAESVTVPVEEFPPTRVEGTNANFVTF